MLKLPLNRRVHQSPPKLGGDRASTQASPSPDLAAAEAGDKDSSGRTKALVGLGLTALGVLTGCSEPVPPAPEPGQYSLDTPDLVVMDANLDRIDLKRETEEECPAFYDEDEGDECEEVDVDYHRVGIHVGHGVVQDLNGNLYVAPQLAGDSGTGVAVANPDSVEAEGALWSKGSVRREGNDFHIKGSLMDGTAKVSIEGDDLVVKEPGLFGDHETMRVRKDGNVVTIVENRQDQELIQSQGDHLLVQTQWGTPVAEIRHDEAEGIFSLDKRSGLDHSVEYSPGSYKRQSDGWGASEITASRTQTDEGHDVEIGIDGFLGWKREAKTSDEGWTSHHGTEFRVQGGDKVYQR